MNKYKCNLCGRIRRVRTFPRSNCICETEFPNRYMYLKWIIINFFVWFKQRIKLILKGGRWTKL